MNGRPWLTRAACTDADAELFYQNGRETDAQATERINAAKDICRGCTARLDCLTWAFEERDQHAILGGTTPEERWPLALGVTA